MNNRIVLQMGLPMDIQNQNGNHATIELNAGNFVVCRYHPNTSVYLNDATLEDWFPVNLVDRKIYLAKLAKFEFGH